MTKGVDLSSILSVGSKRGSTDSDEINNQKKPRVVVRSSINENAEPENAPIKIQEHHDQATFRPSLYLDLDSTALKLIQLNPKCLSQGELESTPEGEIPFYDVFSFPTGNLLRRENVKNGNEDRVKQLPGVSGDQLYVVLATKLIKRLARVFLSCLI
jgi:hypothetical protein